METRLLRDPALFTYQFLSLLLLFYAGLTPKAIGKSILDLQKALQVSSIKGAKGQGKVSLINLNSHLGRWYLYRIETGKPVKTYEFHLENPYQDQTIALDPSQPDTIALEQKGRIEHCQLLTEGIPRTLLQKQKIQKTYLSLCQNRLFLLNQLRGDRSTKEWAVEFLRDHVWGAETLTSMVKNTLYKDKFRLETKAHRATTPGKSDDGAPFDAKVRKSAEKKRLYSTQLGLSLATTHFKNGLFVGRWYRLKQQKGMYLSLMRAREIDPEIMQSYPSRVKPLDAKEAASLNYLLAVDLSQYRVGYALGTEHPRLSWSLRAPRDIRSQGGPGPDGFAHAGPLVRSGSINPLDRQKVVMTFIGGFKRSHGAFSDGPLARINQATHYGFVENGTIFSKLHPGLATAYITAAGKLTIKTWSPSDSVSDLEIRHARQNGYPIIESTAQRSQPGVHVGDGLKGNWSADYFSVQRTLRAGLCSLEHEGRPFLIYGYFSSATTNAMARVFQAYHCDYAMHLDMNLLEHTYLAVYTPTKKHGLKVEHLVRGMAEVDKREGGRVIPRFVGMPDNRDFFYIMAP